MRGSSLIPDPGGSSVPLPLVPRPPPSATALYRRRAARQATAAEVAPRSNPAKSATSISPPQRVRRARSPSRRRRRPRRVRPAVLDDARRHVRVVVLDRQGVEPHLERALRRQVLGVQVVHHQLGLDTESAHDVRRPPGERTRTSPGARGRRCDGWHQHGPFATDTVLLNSAAHRQHLSTGRMREPQRLRGVPASTGAPPAACPRARTTESSQRMWMGRSWLKHAVHQGAQTRRRRRLVEWRWGRRTGSRWS